jgi:pyruvate formate lyase activating enzyme
MERPADGRGIIFKIKRFSVHDGPGIRTSVFLKGCPLKCVWCHSPEGIDSGIYIWYDRSLCISCAKCVNVCPEKALNLVTKPDTIIEIDRKQCSLTGECVKNCPTGALQFTGSITRVSDILTEIIKDNIYYEVSGGGVTITGGEPLYQPDFTRSILESCRHNNIHTAIETCLYAEREIIDSISDFVDLFIVDLKIFDQAQHIRYTGKSNELIKENLRYLANSEKPIVVRIPMIPDFTDSEENRNECLKFLHDIDPRIPVEYIKFNPLAENNYKKLGIPFQLNNQL